jgi:hypothetical protein
MLGPPEGAFRLRRKCLDIANPPHEVLRLVGNGSPAAPEQSFISPTRIASTLPYCSHGKDQEADHYCKQTEKRDDHRYAIVLLQDVIEPRRNRMTETRRDEDPTVYRKNPEGHEGYWEAEGTYKLSDREALICRHRLNNPARQEAKKV